MLLAISFYTIIKLPYQKLEKPQSLVYYLPFVGLIIGLISYGLLILLEFINISMLLKSTILTIYYVVITGGLHFDGLLDSVDSYFSRKTLKEKLQIMHDSHIGAFACIFAICFMFLKVSMAYELLANNIYTFNIILIPIVSRMFAMLLLTTTAPAKNSGFVVTIKTKLSTNKYVYIQLFTLVAIITIVFSNYILSLLIIAIWYFIYRKIIIKEFAGITGDLLGFFIEVTELISMVLLVVNYI